MDIKEWFQKGNYVYVPTKEARALVVAHISEFYPEDNYRYVDNSWSDNYKTLGLGGKTWSLWNGRVFSAIDFEEFFSIFDLSPVKSIEVDLDPLL